MRRYIGAAAALVIALYASGCGECAGSVACGGKPEINVSGQFIEHGSGRGVSGVEVAFVRRSGVTLDTDTVRTGSDRDGYFSLRADAAFQGSVSGKFLVRPPAPYPPYEIPDVSLKVTRTRGDGDNFGRLVVNPFLVLIGVVRDRTTHALMTDVDVTMRRDSGGHLSPDSATFRTDFGGQFALVTPTILDPAPITATFQITAAGRPRSYFVQRSFQPSVRDGQLAVVNLPVGSGWVYVGTTGRRATGAQLAGVSLSFRRTGGLTTLPDSAHVTVSANGSFSIPVEPSGDGTATGELTIVAPPYPTEVRTLTLKTSDDDTAIWLGVLGYGPQLLFTADLRDAVSGDTLATGTVVTVKRTGGVAYENAVPPTLAGDILFVDSLSRMRYQVATTDTGSVTLELVVRLPAPFMWDTIANVSAQARYSDSVTSIGVLPVRRRLPP